MNISFKNFMKFFIIFAMSFLINKNVFADCTLKEVNQDGCCYKYINDFVDSGSYKFRFFGNFDKDDKFYVAIYNIGADLTSERDGPLFYKREISFVSNEKIDYFDVEINSKDFEKSLNRNTGKCDIFVFKNNNFEKSLFEIKDVDLPKCADAKSSLIYNKYLLNSDDKITDASFQFNVEQKGSLPLIGTIFPENKDKNFSIDGVDCSEFVHPSGLKGLNKIKIKVFKFENGEITDENPVAELESSLAKNNNNNLDCFEFKLRDGASGHALVNEEENYVIKIFDLDNNYLGHFSKKFNIEN